ncbi:heavy-metal-associated domain-containing protein [Peribacillus sp. SCS-26]|uniref:heavy-metal-associated domain-containing protein n=1 Tax=Paraperibacillus marinus TaxID=3115295 RepID=UPI0039060FD4
MKAELGVKGMTCKQCAVSIEDKLSRLGGVEQVTVHLYDEKVELNYDEEQNGLPQIIKAIEELGYDIKQT